MIQNCISTEDHNNVSIGNLYQTNSTLNISLLNVCGLLSKQDVPDFIQFIQSNSINCVVETKLNEIDVANLILPVGYQAIFKCRHFCSLSKSGGIGIIYKECLNDFIQEVKTNSSFVSWFIIKRTLSPYFRNLPLLHITIRLHLTSRLLKFMQWLARKQYVLVVGNAI